MAGGGSRTWGWRERERESGEDSIESALSMWHGKVGVGVELEKLSVLSQVEGGMAQVGCSSAGRREVEEGVTVGPCR